MVNDNMKKELEGYLRFLENEEEKAAADKNYDRASRYSSEAAGFRAAMKIFETPVQPTAPRNPAEKKVKLEIQGSAILGIFIAAALQQTQSYAVTQTNREQVFWLEYQGFHTPHDLQLIETYKQYVTVLNHPEIATGENHE